MTLNQIDGEHFSAIAASSNIAFKISHADFAVVINEYALVVGIVTTNDLQFTACRHGRLVIA